MAALRSLVEQEYANELTSYLYQRGSVIAGRPNRYRLKLRERDAQFFKEFIQDEGGIEKLKHLNVSELSDSRENIFKNALQCLDRLGQLTPVQRMRLSQFIINQCILVVVSTPDLDSATIISLSK